MSRSARQLCGDRGEDRAELFLSGRGLRPLTRNYRCRAGELDLVMIDPDTPDGEVLVFVEVRTRGPGSLVDPFATVDRAKQHKLIQAARHFLMSYPQFDRHACRFDVIGLEDPEAQPDWLKSAFDAAG